MENEQAVAILESLAASHGRSTAAIASRLVKLGKLPVDSVPMRYRPA